MVRAIAKRVVNFLRDHMDVRECSMSILRYVEDARVVVLFPYLNSRCLTLVMPATHHTVVEISLSSYCSRVVAERKCSI